MSCWFSHNLQPNYSCSTLVFQAREALLYVCTPMTEPAALHYWINLTQLCLFNDVWHLLTTLLLLFYIYGAQHARMTVACNGTVKLYSISWRHMIHMHNGHASFSHPTALGEANICDRAVFSEHHASVDWCGLLHSLILNIAQAVM